jgi:hypothetical protein
MSGPRSFVCGLQAVFSERIAETRMPTGSHRYAALGAEWLIGRLLLLAIAILRQPKAAAPDFAAHCGISQIADASMAPRLLDFASCDSLR